MERMHVPSALDGSWDSIIHNLSNGRNSLLIFEEDRSEAYAKEEYLTNEAEEKIRAEGNRGQRAIGVVYNPEYERYGNYVPTVLSNRYDASLFIDKSHALHPLHMPIESEEDERDLPETFPTGL